MNFDFVGGANFVWQADPRGASAAGSGAFPFFVCGSSYCGTFGFAGVAGINSSVALTWSVWEYDYGYQSHGELVDTVSLQVPALAQMLRSACAGGESMHGHP